MNSNVTLRAAVSWARGNATGTTTVAMEVTKIQPFATHGPATLKPNLLARMDAVSRNRGTVILIMIAEMVPTSRRTFVASGIVPPGGDAVPNGATIAAFLNGCSAMERMIVAMVIFISFN